MLERFTNFKISVKDKKKTLFTISVKTNLQKYEYSYKNNESIFSLMYIWAKQGPTRKRSGTLKRMLIK